MKNLHLTQEQVTQILEEIAQRKEGVMMVMQIALEAIMRAEREVFNQEYGDVSNGYRMRKTFGHGKLLELRVPRTRFGAFYPVILALLKDQEEEIRKIAFSLYGAGLTTQQVSKIFEEIYGKAYSTSQISRLFESAREEVRIWLERPLEAYYPIIFIDATFIHVKREDSVSKEAFYTVLGVKPDLTREVLAIVNMPTENVTGWTEVFRSLRKRGVEEIGLMVSDNITGITDAISRIFGGTDIQLCAVHLMRNTKNKVNSKDKPAVKRWLKDIFRTGDSSYTRQQAIEKWEAFCDYWGRKYPGIKRMKKDPIYWYYFTYLQYDYRIQSMIYSTNWIERLNRDYKRVTRMRGALPNSDSALLLLGHVAMTKEAYKWKVTSLKYETEKFRWSE